MSKKMIGKHKNIFNEYKSHFLENVKQIRRVNCFEKVKKCKKNFFVSTFSKKIKFVEKVKIEKKISKFAKKSSFLVTILVKVMFEKSNVRTLKCQK
jgi:hypothetical protein